MSEEDLRAAAEVSVLEYNKDLMCVREGAFEREGELNVSFCTCQEEAKRVKKEQLRMAKDELPKIKKACRRRAFIYMLEFPAEPNVAVDTFREVMELMAPDVL